MQTLDHCKKVLLTSVFCTIAIYLFIGQKAHQNVTPSVPPEAQGYDVFSQSPTKRAATSTSMSSTAAPSIDEVTTTEPPDLNTDVINPHPYSFILNKPNLCKTADGKEPTLVILVPSASTNFQQRKAIRVTWGNTSMHQGFKLAFLLGYPKIKAVQPMILAEDNLYHDVIQEDFTDVYHNLPLKSVMMVRWVTEHCPEAKFVLKIDDDMLLNIWGLWAEIETTLRGASRTMWGLLAQRWTPNRNSVSKWYLPVRVYKKRVFPDFLTGPAYLFTGDCAPVLYNVSFTVPYLPLEDVFLTGVVAKKAGIARKNHAGFLNYQKILQACAEPRQITSHGYKPLTLMRLWRALSLKYGFSKCKIRHSGRNVTVDASGASVSPHAEKGRLQSYGPPAVT